MTAKHRQIDVFSGLVLLWTLGYAEGALTLLLLTDAILGMTFPLLRLLSYLYTPKSPYLWIMLYALKGFALCEPFYYPKSSHMFMDKSIMCLSCLFTGTYQIGDGDASAKSCAIGSRTSQRRAYAIWRH
jgi:hypothetical protein